MFSKTIQERRGISKDFSQAKRNKISRSKMFKSKKVQTAAFQTFQEQRVTKKVVQSFSGTTRSKRICSKNIWIIEKRYGSLVSKKQKKRQHFFLQKQNRRDLIKNKPGFDIGILSNPNPT